MDPGAISEVETLSPDEVQVTVTAFQEELLLIHDAVTDRWFLPESEPLSEDNIEEIAEIGQQYLELVRETQLSSIRERFELIGQAVERVGKALDLETREKVLEFVVEMIPFVGAAYAVAGRRMKLVRQERTGLPIPSIEPITLPQRAEYALTEIIPSPILRIVKGAAREAELDKRFMAAFESVRQQTAQYWQSAN